MGKSPQLKRSGTKSTRDDSRRGECANTGNYIMIADYFQSISPKERDA